MNKRKNAITAFFLYLEVRRAKVGNIMTSFSQAQPTRRSLTRFAQTILILPECIFQTFVILIYV